MFSDDAVCLRALTALGGDERTLLAMIAAEQAIGGDPFGLDPIERVLVRLWTSSGSWHRIFNGEMDGRPLALGDYRGVFVLQARFDTAIRKLPSFAGVCFRGVRAVPPSTERLEPVQMGSARTNAPDWRAFWVDRVGQTLRWNRYSSASADPDRAFSGELLFTIVSRAGRRLQGYAEDEGEQEILFLPGTLFHMIECIACGDRLNVTLIEIV
ncbi:hypothetical protein [Blastochloris tepida]|uniref:NAD(+)--protein-arginine ADP-ribosyltransferase n=1 Tax=Blastochloris tepida TaxID=2233851 RepID=A0A348FWU8_9HYPH|nr:hypothetical protein [Blastochloris tepida]BBF91781.1 hypothetical protein BLTE_04660 [Blastochloris tepida]